MNKQNKPLVSIVVITYNSSKYVLETLESCKDQTYDNIELVVSDDASTDGTVEVCEEWLSKNSDRFLNVKLVRAEKNSGIPANCNRGVKNSEGKWIKFIAGDDALKSTCVEDNVDHVNNHEGIEVLLSTTEGYASQFEASNHVENLPNNKKKEFFNKDKSAKDQFMELLLGDKIKITPSAFIKKETIIRLGMYDEKYRLIEDYPMWLKLTRNGIKIHFMDKITVKHRRHDESVNNLNANLILKPAYFRDEHLREDLIYPYLNKFEVYKRKLNYRYAKIFRFFGLLDIKNKRYLKFVQKYLNPISYITFILGFFKYTAFKKEEFL